jgi:hypothetical protein
MFTHRITMNLKAGAAPELTRVTETEIIPLLRKQQGFHGEITSIAPGSDHAASDSYWDTKEDAEAYHRTGYQESLKSLLNVVVGLPMVGTFEISNSTFHMIGAKAA